MRGRALKRPLKFSPPKSSDRCEHRVNRSLVQQIGARLERLIARHTLGLTPDPATWPMPADIDSLPLHTGIEKTGEKLIGRVLDAEFLNRWPHRRTIVGAHAYRFENNGEYDCGWRLANLAARFIQTGAVQPHDLLITIPPPQVYRSVQALDWSGERLARLLDCTFRPDLVGLSAPLSDHADRLTKLPAPWGDLFRLNRPESVFNKRVLLCDWRWEKGKSMTAVSKLLRHAGAEVLCFAWIE